MTYLAAILAVLGLFLGFIFPAIVLDNFHLGSRLRHGFLAISASPAFPVTIMVSLTVVVALVFLAWGVAQLSPGWGIVYSMVLAYVVGLIAGLGLTPAN